MNRSLEKQNEYEEGVIADSSRKEIGIKYYTGFGFHPN